MQQQICQQEQLSQQQQQVMLCPVRLVYETQILVQPGEQIQPNQTLFINPQNPPPWIQNRAQNQVIYMQQLPNNMMPSVPQHIDQNQLYIQNYAYPQQMMQVDQMRQMPNVMTQNMMGIGTNVGHTIQNVGQSIQNVGPSIQNVGMNVGQNVMPMANVVQNVQKVVPSFSQNVGNDRIIYSTVPNVSNNTLTMANNQAVVNVNQTMQERPVQMNQNLVNMQKVSELQGLKQQSVRQPQVTVSPMQNVKYGSNVGDVRPMTMTPRSQATGSNMNLGPNMQANVMAKNKVPLPNKASPVMTNQVRHYNQTYYRPIQPRPMSVMPMVQNQYLPMQPSNLAPRPQTQVNTELNRKRKSESPDETRKKIPNNGNNSIISSQIIAALQNTQNGQNLNINNQMVKVVQSDVGVNTNPVQREMKQVKNVETMSTGTQANIAREKPQYENLKKALEIKAIPANLVKDNFSVNVQTETDKLVRNTVFTQARGLLRTEPQMLQPDIISIEKIPNIVPKTINVIENIQHTIPTPTNLTETVSIVTTENVTEAVTKECTKAEFDAILNDVPIEIVIKVNKNKPVNEPVQQELPKLEKEEPTIKNEVVKAEIKMETSDIPKTEVEEKKPVKVETKEPKEESKKFTVTSISDFKGNEIQIADGSVRKEDTDSFILTHVLDGYVIQESNMAFPIRKPLKERIIYQNTDLGSEHKKEETYKHRTEDGKVIKDNSRILAISDLNLSEDDKIKDEEQPEEQSEVSDNPFSDLKPDTIKSWSVTELTAHLSKHNWTETIAVLSEHEIDGESLFLVSKPQLVQIGVSEAHADVICEFIKK